MIHECLGEDAKIFSEDETPTPSELYKRLNDNPDELGEEISFLTKVRQILREHQETVQKVEELPRYIKVAKKYKENNMVVTIKRTNNLYFLINYKDHPVSLEEIIECIKCEPSEPKQDLSKSFWENYDKLKKSYTHYLEGDVSSMGLNKKSNVSDKEKAIYVIKEILNKNPNWLDEDLQKFLESLLEDLIYYSTLPAQVIKKIASVTKDHPITDQKHIEEMFTEIKYFVGSEYFVRVKEASKKIRNEIIICIENQQYGK